MDAPDIKSIRLTELAHGGGCGCKLAPAMLESIIARSGAGLLPKQLLVGIETSDEPKMLAGQSGELDRTIRKLVNLRDSLRHAAACRAPSHMECPTFRGILRAARLELSQHEGKRVSRHCSLT